MDHNPRWHTWIVFLTAILLIAIMGLTVGGRNRVTFVENSIGQVITPVHKLFSAMSQFTSDKVRPLTEIWEAQAENVRLREENQNLSQALIEATLTQQELTDLQELEASLNYAKRNEINNYITCNVIAKDVGNWYNMFVIDAGAKDGIVKNSTVMCGEGIVGLVYEVGEDWSKVVSIIDNKSTISFEILDPDYNYDGKVTGSIDAILTGLLFEPQAEVHIGDQIVTSGLGLYPKGILIGRITDVIVDKDSLLKKITVQPAVNFRKLDRVFVIPKTNTFIE